MFDVISQIPFFWLDFFHWWKQYYQHTQLALMVVATFFEGPPVSFLAGVLAGANKIDPYWYLVLGTPAVLLSDILWYVIGRFFKKAGDKVVSKSKAMKRGTTALKHMFHNPASLFLTKLVWVIRPAMFVVAGANKEPLRYWLPWTMGAAAFWTLSTFWLGSQLGHRALKYTGNVKTVIIAVSLLGVAYLLWAAFRKAKTNGSK